MAVNGINFNMNRTPMSYADMSGGDRYQGTIDGMSTIVDQSRLADLDPGSVTLANVGGMNYGAVSPEGGSFLDSVGGYLKDQKLSDIAGTAGLAFNAYNSLFGPQADLYKEQLGLLRDKRAANQEALQNRRDVNRNTAEGFNLAFQKA